MKSKHLFLTTGMMLMTCATVALVWAQSSNSQTTEKKAVEPAANPKAMDPWVASGSYVVRVSPENNHVWAFSKHTDFGESNPLKMSQRTLPTS